MSSPSNPNMAADLPPIGLRRVVYLQANRAPTVLDSKYRDGSYYEFNTEWRDLSKTPPQIWKLATINSKIDAVWFLLGPGSGPPPSPPALQFTPTTGSVVFPNVSTGNVNVYAGTGITVTGTTETLTIALSGGGPAIETITGDDGTPESPSSNNFNLLGAVVANGTHAKPVYVLGSAATETVQVQQAKAVTPTPANNNDIGLASYSNAQFAVDSSSGMVTLLGGANPAIQGLIPDTGSNVTADPATGLIKVETVNPSGTVNPQLPTQGIAAHTFGVCAINTAKWIVDPTAGVGTHQTITAALTAASSGDTIFIRPGTYTENLTLKAGVNLASYTSEALTPNVTIIGNATLSTVGSVSIAGIRLQTNGANPFLTVSGSVASIVNLQACYLNCASNTGISFTSSSSSSQINVYSCVGNLGTTGVAFSNSSSAGDIYYWYCRFTNTGGSSTATTCSAGSIFFEYSQIQSPLSCSSTSRLQINWSFVFCNLINTTGATFNGNAGNSGMQHSYVTGGTASAVSIGTGVTAELYNSQVSSSNTNTITGAGTLRYTALSFVGGSGTINTTTQQTDAFGPRIQVGGATNSGCQLLSGAGSPNGSVTAPKGSLWLRTDGSGVNDRIWVNTDAGTTWTYMVTGA